MVMDTKLDNSGNSGNSPETVASKIGKPLDHAVVQVPVHIWN